MRPYAFRVKKNRFVMELSSENPELIAAEFANFANEFLVAKIESNVYEEPPLASRALPDALKKTLKAKTKLETLKEAQLDTKVTEKIVETKELPKVLPAALKKTLKSKKEQEIIEEKTEKTVAEETTLEKIVETKELPKVLPAALKKTLKSKIEPVILENFEQSVDIDAEYTQQIDMSDDFEKMLMQKTQETNNVVEKKISELQKTYQQMQQVIKQKRLRNNLDYVVAAAYCLTQYEGMLRFTEENIKSKVFPFLAEKFEHNDILDAIDKRFFRVIPDFTGVSDTIEFELTDYGEEYFLNEL